ncbi:S-layer homology domain-containing protein [Bacillus songklensis]|uniref:S-layer homology domain-containing protein n=1 Tax=Bacillus songklensis TaxID=1069116 RepID=A0ABV8B8S2_9BACI
MKKIRVLLAGLMTASLLPFNAAFAAEKTSDMYIAEDLEPDKFAYEEMDDFMAADIIDGSVDKDGYVYVKPNGQITRAQFVKILVNALDLKSDASAKTFNDVKSSDWFYPYVQTANSLGIVTGRPDGGFDPYEKIRRDQMAVMIHRAFKSSVTFKPVTKTFKDVPKGRFGYDEINAAAANGIITGYGDVFKPTALATRAQGIVMIHRALQQQKSALPNEQELQSFLRNHIIAENRAAEVMNTDELVKLYNSNTTGYYRAMGLDSLEMYKDIYGDDVQMSMKADEDFNVHTISLSNNYVKLEVTDILYHLEIKFGKEGEGMKMDFDMSGEYSLKKDANGQWKIYNFIPYDEELEDTPFLAVNH